MNVPDPPLSSMNKMHPDLRLVELYAAGQRRFAEIQLSLDSLERHLRDSGIALEKVSMPAELFLAAAAATRDPVAVETFQREVLRPALNRLVHLHLSASERDDMNQVLLTKLIFSDGPAGLAKYHGRGNLLAWVRMIAAREVVHRRQRDKVASASSLESVATRLYRVADQEMSHVRSAFGPRLQLALEQAILSLSGDEKLLLQMHFEQELGIDDLASIFQIHRSTAARRLVETRKRIFERVQESLGAVGRAVSTTELRSIARDLHHDLHLTLDRVLQPRDQ